MVLALLVIAFIVMPLLELYVAIEVGRAIGALNTIGLLILMSLLGFWLARHEGLGVLQRIRRQTDAGQVPTDGLIDGALVLAGGILLILPGFVSDVIGLLVLFPPIRAVLRNLLRRRLTVVSVRRYNGPFDDPRGPGSGPPVIDV